MENQAMIGEILRAFPKSWGDIYYKAYSDEEYDGAYIKNLDDRLLIEQTYNSEQGYTKIDSVRATTDLSKVEKKFKIDSLSRQYLLPRVNDFVKKKDLEHMATKINQKVNFRKLGIVGVEFSSNKNDNQISIPVFNLNKTIALIFDRSPDEF